MLKKYTLSACGHQEGRMLNATFKWAQRLNVKLYFLPFSFQDEVSILGLIHYCGQIITVGS